MDEHHEEFNKAARNWIVLATDPTDDAEELAEAFDSTPPEPELGGEREPLGYASYPWDALKRQAHDVKEVTDLVYTIDKFLASGWHWDVSGQAWLRDETWFKLISEDDRSQIGTVTGIMAMQSAELLRMEKRLNRLLYLMMTGTSQ